jgi:hypothetical protein
MNKHWKENSEGHTICHRKNLPATGRNTLSEKETFCHRKKPLVTRRSIERLTYKWMSTMLRKRCRLLKMFLCFEMLSKSLKIL